MLKTSDLKLKEVVNVLDGKRLGGITDIEIDIETGRKLTRSITIRQGNGGRDLESSHLYKINWGILSDGGRGRNGIWTYGVFIKK